MSLDNSLTVGCGDVVVVVAAKNAVAADDFAAIVGVATVLVIWVQRRWMRPCTSLQSHFVLVVVTLRGNEPS